MLRWLVSSWIRQNAMDQVQKAVHAAADGEAAPDESEPPILCDIAVVFALPIEAGGTIDLLSESVTLRGSNYVEHVGILDSRPVTVLETGVGIEASARAVADMLLVRKPQWVISVGFAGGLDAVAKQGDLVMADTIVDTTGQQLKVGLKMSTEAMPGVHSGRLLTVDKLINDPEEKQSLGQEHNAIACDMETMAVAQECREHETRFLSVRIISDSAGQQLPAHLVTLVEQKTLSSQLGAAAAAVFRKPSAVKEMWQLRENALRLSDRLAQFLKGVVEQLP